MTRNKNCFSIVERNWRLFSLCQKNNSVSEIRSNFLIPLKQEIGTDPLVANTQQNTICAGLHH